MISSIHDHVNGSTNFLIFVSIQAYHGHFGVLEELLYKYHSYLDSKDGKGRTPLDLAAYKGYK